MTEKNKNSKNKEMPETDPFDELNELDDNFTSIETEKDYFNDLERKDVEELPDYDSESGEIIHKEAEKEAPVAEAQEEKVPFMDQIDNVAVSNPNSLSKPVILHKPKSLEDNSDKKVKKVQKLKNDKNKSSMPKPKKVVKSLESQQKSKKDDTKVIDNVKVDEDGVPLLNQFDTEKIKESRFLPKIRVKKFNLSKIIMILVGIIFIIVGLIEANMEIIRISDSVMYGEHASMSMLLIFVGVILIVLSFYKELMKLAGLNNLNYMDDTETNYKHRNNKKDKKDSE